MVTPITTLTQRNQRKIQIYGAPFRKILVTFMDTIFNFCTTSIFFFLWGKTFLINSTHIYIQQELFIAFVFCATLNIFSQYESSFGCHIIFFVATTYFCDLQNFVCNVNFYVKYIFCWHNSFLCNKLFFCAS